MQDAPDGHPEGTAGGADLSDRIVEAGPTPEDVKKAGCGDQGGEAAHGDAGEAIEIVVGVVVLAAHDEPDTDPDEGDGHDRPGEAHPEGKAVVEDFADEPCAPEPHGEGGEHADEEGADPPDVVSMVGHDRPEGITRRSGATTPCSGLFLCGCGRRRPFLRRLLGRGLLALLSSHSASDANRPSCQHWAPCGQRWNQYVSPRGRLERSSGGAGCDR